MLYGKETYLLENSLKKIKKLFGQLSYGLNYIKIDDSNINTLISEIQTPAFGFEKKLIIVSNIELLKKQTKKKNLHGPCLSSPSSSHLCAWVWGSGADVLRGAWTSMIGAAVGPTGGNRGRVPPHS